MTTDLIMSDQIDWKARVEEMKRRAETIRTDEPDTWPFPDEAIANDYAALLSRITELEAEPDWKARALKAEGEVERLKPIPSEFEEMFGVCYRSGPPTAEDYDEALEALQNARTALVEGDSMGCRVCEDSGHGANQCHHNPLLLARKWASAARFWQCWHCGFVATNDAEGREHFGEEDGSGPSCLEALRTDRDALQSKLTRLVEAAKAAQSFTSIMLASPFWREATDPVRGEVERINSALARTLSEALESTKEPPQ